MSNPTFDQREQIRDAIDIVDLVERYVPLRRQGANFVGRCPWHDDSRPSLQVNPQRQTFKCWVCNLGGDVFSFVMKIENVDFKEAMQILADMAGIELKKWKKPTFSRSDGSKAPYRKINSTNLAVGADPNTALDAAYYASQADESGGNPGVLDISGVSDNFNNLANATRPNDSASTFIPPEITKTVLYRALDWLAGKYRETFLHSSEAEAAREYIRERGISDASSERFQIGYAPLEYDAVLNWIGGARSRVLALETSGVLAFREETDAAGRLKPRPPFEPTPTLSAAERRRYYDRFRGRVIFPIRDVQRRVVAFGGRLLPNSTLNSPAKYVNSPETPIFTKSKMVYGLDAARGAIAKTKKVLVVEGYTDCIMASQFGFENVVAVLGTALGAEHIRILKRFADKMTLLLDGDEAGQKRAREVLRFFVEQGVDANVLTLPNNADPCEFLLERGAEAFEELLENGTVDALEHAFRAATKGIDLENDVVESAKALDSLLEIVALFPERSTSLDDPVRLRTIKTLQRFAGLFRVSEAEIRRQLAQKRQKQRVYSDRYERRESRYAERNGGTTTKLKRTLVPEEARIEEFRRGWIYPIAGPDDESDVALRSRFVPFETTVWNDERLRPRPIEREYLELWLTEPTLYARVAERIPFESLRSPVSRQLDLLARDFLSRGENPTFERVLSRYESDEMKSFLIDLDAKADEKRLRLTLANDETREPYLRQLFAAFERERFERETPKKIGELRENELTPQAKIQALLEYRARLLQQQENRVGGTVFTDENGPDGKRFDDEK